MKARSKFAILLALLFSSVSLFSQSYHVRIGFIGNSITIGSGLTNPKVECYPSQIALLLNAKYGDTCIVTNYAVSGRTMLKEGDFPWWNETDFTKCWNYAPDICFIALGTNDTKPYNWDPYGDNYFTDYQSLIDTFKVRNPLTKFIVCMPPPAFGVAYDIRPEIISGNIIPLVDSIAKVNSLDIVDFYHPMLDSGYLFPDKIHPTAKGAKVLAKIAFDEIVSSDIIHKIQTGRAMVTSLGSTVPGDLRSEDTATIRWVTINADEVYLNGVLVDSIGSILIKPAETTVYKLVAKGESSADSISYVQNVYVPELVRFNVAASRWTIIISDTTKLKLNLYDQKNKLITDSVFDATWSVVEGSGHFVNQGNNTIQFVGDAKGTAKLSCTIGDITYSFSITIKGFPTDIGLNNNTNEWSVYPNPFTNQLTISVPVEKPGKLTINLYDTGGRLCKTETRQVKEPGNPTIEMSTDKIPAGIYMLTLEISGKSYSGKVVKE